MIAFRVLVLIQTGSFLHEKSLRHCLTFCVSNCSRPQQARHTASRLQRISASPSDVYVFNLEGVICEESGQVRRPPPQHLKFFIAKIIFGQSFVSLL